MTKTVDNGSPNVGDTVTYTMTLTNAGPDAATNVLVTDVLPTGVSLTSAQTSAGSYDSGTGVWSVGSLALSTSVTLTIAATVDSGTGGTTITNSAEVTASDQADPDSTPGNGVPAEDDQDSAAITVRRADLSVSKTDDADPVRPNVTLVYTVTVTNNGPSDARNVVVTDTLPGGVTFVSASAGCTEAGGAVTCSLGDLSSGASQSVSITVTVDPQPAATITNTATVSSDTEDPDSTNNSASEDTTIGGGPPPLPPAAPPLPPRPPRGGPGGGRP